MRQNLKMAFGLFSVFTVFLTSCDTDYNSVGVDII